MPALPAQSTRPGLSDWTVRLEMAYLVVLPFLGAIGAFFLDTEFANYIVWAGWLLALMNLYIHAPMVQSGYKRKGWRMLLPLGSTAAIALKHGLSSGDIWLFFLDEAVMESGALMIGFAVIFLLGTGIAGDSAWEALGPGLVIFVVLLFVGSAGGLFLAWLEQLEHQPTWTLTNYAVAAVFAVYHKVVLIKGMRDGKFNPDDMFSENFFPLIIVIFGWMFGLGVINALINS